MAEMDLDELLLSSSVQEITDDDLYRGKEKQFKTKPCILEDQTGQYPYRNQLEASQSATATYSLLMMHGKEFHAVPVGSWDEDGNHSDKGEEDEEERAPRKNAHGLTTKGVDDEEEGGKEDFDLDFETEIGYDWEHRDTFSGDDEHVDIEPDERPDLADIEYPTPPEVKQEDESPSPVLAPNLKDEFECEPQENNPAKLTATGLAICTPPASRSTQKRKSGGDDAKTSNGAAPATAGPVCTGVPTICAQQSAYSEAAPSTVSHVGVQNETNQEASMDMSSGSQSLLHIELHKKCCASEACWKSGESETSVDSVQGKEISCSEFDATQVFVNLFGTCISIQNNLNLLNVKLLVEAACEKSGMKLTDVYSTFHGNFLEPEHPLSYYKIQKDSTINVNPRVRGGSWPRKTGYDTWDEIIKGKSPYHTVNLPADLGRFKTKQTSATYLADHLRYYTRLLMIGMCRKHFSGISFGGKFTSSQLLFKDGEFEFDDAIDPEPYSRNSAELDLAVIAQIIHDASYDKASQTYPLHVDNLLRFLLTLPLLAEPDSDAVIAFLTNHFAVLSYTERVAVSKILDNLIARLSLATRKILESCLQLFAWDKLIYQVFEMKKVYFYDAVFSPQGNLISVPYKSDGTHCLHLSNNFFKHTGRFPGSSLSLEMLEASFSLLMEKQNFLPMLLEAILVIFVNKIKPIPVDVQLFINDVITMLGKNTIGCKRKVVGPRNNTKT